MITKHSFENEMIFNVMRSMGLIMGASIPKQL
jgi:hypothetical protein